MNQDLQEISRKKKRKNKIAIAILVIGTVLAFILFGTKNKDEVIEEKEPIVKVVETILLEGEKQSIAYLEKTVKVGSNQSAEAIAEYSGRVTGINFNVGDYVNAGQVLVNFDQSNVNNSAKVSYESAQKSYELAEKSLDDARDAADKSVDLAENAVDLAELQLEQAKDDGDEDAIDLAEEALKSAKDREDQAEISADAQINSAKLQREQARLQLEQAQIGFEKTFIKAPISGFVVSKKVADNDYLSAGRSVAQIAKGGNLETVVYLNESEASRIIENEPVNVSYLGEKFTANIKAVADIANSENQRFEVLIELDSKDQNLINQNVKIEIPLKIENSNGFFIPLRAVNIGQDRNEIFIVKDGKAMAVEVELGQIIGDQVEIIKGLRQNDNLIVNGNRNIRDGEDVQVKQN